MGCLWVQMDALDALRCWAFGGFEHLAVTRSDIRAFAQVMHLGSNSGMNEIMSEYFTSLGNVGHLSRTMLCY